MSINGGGHNWTEDEEKAFALGYQKGLARSSGATGNDGLFRCPHLNCPFITMYESDFEAHMVATLPFLHPNAPTEPSDNELREIANRGRAGYSLATDNNWSERESNVAAYRELWHAGRSGVCKVLERLAAETS